MLLFGIPHKGLVVDDIQKMLSERGMGPHPREALVKQIEEGSGSLAERVSSFKEIIRGRKIVSFYETVQTKRLAQVCSTTFSLQTSKARSPY
jgi:protein SERAC1